MNSRNKIRIPRTRKAVIFLLFFVFILTIAALWVRDDWSRSAATLEQRREQARIARKAVLEADKISIESLSSTTLALEEVGRTSCGTSSVQSWRHYVSDEAGKREEACEQLVSDTRSASEATRRLIEYLEGEYRIAEIVKDTMVRVDNLDPYRYDEAIEIWQQAASAFESLEAGSEEVKKQTGQIAESANSVAEAYSALKEADASNKRPDYDNAYINLQKAYQSFNDVNGGVADRYRERAEEVITALSRL